MVGFELPGGVQLRLLTDHDVDELHALVSANRDHLARWLPWAARQTIADSRAFIRTTRRQFAENNGFQLAIVEDGRIVGIVGFHSVSWPNRTTTIGYWLAEDAQGHGTMTSAVRALVDHAFGTWGLNRVEIRAAVENARSRAVAERLGFREEGTVREAERVGERFFDHVVYGMLARDWNQGPELSPG
jgi:ribosomal-protein-serine acetyltransferase